MDTIVANGTQSGRLEATRTWALCRGDRPTRRGGDNVLSPVGVSLRKWSRLKWVNLMRMCVERKRVPS